MLVVVTRGSPDKKDLQKLAFMLQQYRKESPFQEKKQLATDVQQALAWVAGKTPQERMRHRESMVAWLEGVNAHKWATGECEAWLEACTHGAKDVVKAVNGPLLTALAQGLSYGDMGAIEALQAGAPLYGLLDSCGMGAKLEAQGTVDVEEVFADRGRSNAELLRQLDEGEHAEEILKITRADAKLGRMSEPVQVQDVDLDEIRLCPRFAIVQGEHADGRPKVRPIDNFSWSAPVTGKRKRASKVVMRSGSINGHTVMPEKLVYEHLDSLVMAVEYFVKRAKVRR